MKATFYDGTNLIKAQPLNTKSVIFLMDITEQNADELAPQNGRSPLQKLTEEFNGKIPRRMASMTPG